MKKKLYTLLTIMAIAALPAYSLETRYVAPNATGAGDGSSAVNAADFKSTAFWSGIQTLLATDSVTVQFIAGTYSRAYTQAPFVLQNLGHAHNLLTLEGDPTGTLFTAPTGHSPKGDMINISDCQHMIIRNFRFSGNGEVGYVMIIRSGTGKTSRDIRVENCHWTDMLGVVYGATGCTGSGTYNVTYEDCTFTRIGKGNGSHMMYHSYDAHHISVINCDFEDCKGDYVRFRDNCDFGVVKGCTFNRNAAFAVMPFISIPLFNDVNPGDEFFGTHYAFTGNSFTNSNHAVKIHHYGHDPVGYRYLLTAAEGSTLSTGTPLQKQSILMTNFGIDASEIRVAGNTYTSMSSFTVAMGSKAQYGSVSKGWDSVANITDAINSSATPLAWESGGASYNEPWVYNLNTGTGTMGSVYTSASGVAAGVVSSVSTPGFLPYPPGGIIRVGLPATGEVFTLMGDSLKINSGPTFGPAKFSAYSIPATSPVAGFFYTITFNDSTSTRIQWTLSLGNNNAAGSTGVYSNNGGLTTTGTTSNPEVFNVLGWSINPVYPDTIRFQYREKPLASSTSSFKTINSTHFKRGGTYHMEIYANNLPDAHTYTRGGVNYTLPARTYNIWADGTLFTYLGSPNFPANQLAAGTALNSFLFFGTNSNSNPVPNNTNGDNSAAITLSNIQMNLAPDPLPSLTAPPAKSKAIKVGHIKKNSLLIIPNPVGNQLYLQYAAAHAGDAYVRIVHANGRVALVKKETLSAGSNRIILDVSSLPPGMYVLDLSKGMTHESASFIKAP